MHQSFGQRLVARAHAHRSAVRSTDQELRVRVNVPVLLGNLSTATGCALCEADVMSWLSEAGFSRSDGGTWLVREVDLGQLDTSEVGIVADEN